MLKDLKMLKSTLENLYILHGDKKNLGDFGNKLAENNLKYFNEEYESYTEA